MRAARRGQRRGAPTRAASTRTGALVWLSWLGAWSEPVKRLFFVGRDMTESRLAQETLRESEQLARGIIDTALDAFVQIDEKGIVRDWNSQAEKIFGWPRDEALGNETQRTDRPRTSTATRIKAGLERFLRTGAGADPRPPPRTRGEAARRNGDQGRAEHHRAEDAATASCSTDSSATSPTGSRPRTGSGRPRRWRRSASSPAASRMTSTIS